MTHCDNTPDAPAWFARAVGERPQRLFVEIAGAAIHYRTWGAPDRPALVVVHGAGAHSGWWDHIAPLMGAHRVVSIDLSGHGDSGHRDSYDMGVWAQEILGVSAAAGLDRPVLVGHSMGGRAAVTTAVEHPDSVAAVVCVDTPLTRRRRGGVDRDGHHPVQAPSIHPSVEEAVARFRTRPREQVLPAYVRDHVARESVRRVEGGWTWKSDQGVFGRGGRMQDLLPRVHRPMALLRGERGLVPAAMAQDMSRMVAGPMPVVELPDAGHHPMLDQPLTLVTALRTLLAVWPDGGVAGTDSWDSARRPTPLGQRQASLGLS